MDTLLDNLIIFGVFSILMTLLSLMISPKLLNPKNRLFRERAWEANGAFYQRFFKVKSWKDSLPELSTFIKKLFSKKKIRNFDRNYLQTYITESCRAELTHFCIIGSAFLFPMWSESSISLTIIYISIILNFPFIIIQRYNRPRILRLLGRNKHVFSEIKAEDFSF